MLMLLQSQGIGALVNISCMKLFSDYVFCRMLVMASTGGWNLYAFLEVTCEINGWICFLSVKTLVVFFTPELRYGSGYPYTYKMIWQVAGQLLCSLLPFWALEFYIPLHFMFKWEIVFWRSSSYFKILTFIILIFAFPWISRDVMLNVTVSISIN